MRQLDVAVVMYLKTFPSEYILRTIILKLLRDINLQAQIRRHKFGCNIDLSMELKDCSINQAVALKLYRRKI